MEKHSFEEFVHVYRLPPVTPIKRACEIRACGHSKLYKDREQGLLRIVPTAGGSGVPTVDLYKLYLQSLGVEAA